MLTNWITPKFPLWVCYIFNFASNFGLFDHFLYGFEPLTTLEPILNILLKKKCGNGIATPLQPTAIMPTMYNECRLDLNGNCTRSLIYYTISHTIEQMEDGFNRQDMEVVCFRGSRTKNKAIISNVKTTKPPMEQ